MPLYRAPEFMSDATEFHVIFWNLNYGNETVKDEKKEMVIFTSVRGMDYTPDVRKRICLIPPTDIRSAWKEDYKSMCSSMIFGEKPTFEELLRQMETLEKRFREG